MLLFLFVKHFICDFPLQAYSWLYLNKGKYGHLGGIMHSLIHGLGTFLVMSYWLGLSALLFGLLDMLIHYHIDWLKMNVNNKYNLKPDNSEWFWIFLGFDQLLHHITYFGLVALYLNNI